MQWAATQGTTTRELMARAGHASPDAALRYQYATEDRDAAIASALSTLAQTPPVVPIFERRAGYSRDESSGERQCGGEIAVSSCSVVERATGIEPAFSAWETHREMLLDPLRSGKVQLSAFRTQSLLFAIARCLSLRVARMGPEGPVARYCTPMIDDVSDTS
jgi:hypothetical protein